MGAIQSGDEKEMALRYIASGGEKMSDLVSLSNALFNFRFLPSPRG